MNYFKNFFYLKKLSDITKAATCKDILRLMNFLMFSMLFLVLLCLLCSCKTGPEKLLIGKWENTEDGRIVEFRKDKTTTWQGMEGEDWSGSYKLIDETLKLELSSSDESSSGLVLIIKYEYNVTELSEDTLVITGKDKELRYRRVDN